MMELEAQAEKENIPIIGPVVGELLYILASAAKAKKILELGTAIGYSAIYLARACESADGALVTFENNSDMAARAKENFRKAGVSERVEIHEADVLDMLPRLQGDFDFIFLDIEKKDYVRILPDCQRLLVQGGPTMSLSRMPMHLTAPYAATMPGGPFPCSPFCHFIHQKRMLYAWRFGVNE